MPVRGVGVVVGLVAVALIYQGVRSRAQDVDVTFRLLIVSEEAAAARLAEEIAGGASMETLAAQRSIDASASTGGLIGPIALASLRQELREALAGMAPGTLSGVIRVPTGFALVQRIDPTTARVVGSREIGAIAATGSVKPTASVDGFNESNTAFDSFDKPADWHQDPGLICSLRQQSGARVADSLTRILATAETPATRARFTPLEIVESHVALGQLHAYYGRMPQVIASFERALALASREIPAAVPDLEEMLGIAHLHKAELDHDIYHQPGDRCLLGSGSVQPFADTTDLDKALGYFAKYLNERPRDLEVRWLLNVAHAVSGGYPAKVPQPWLIPQTAFASPEDVGRFTDVAAEWGVDSFSSAGGVVVDDFDNDGQLEILTSNFESCGVMQLYRRAGYAGPGRRSFSEGARFEDLASKAGLADQRGGLNMVQADYNNDGCRDVLVLRGGWETAQRKSLLRNNCDGTFTDVTVAAGLARPATSTQTAVWTDIDNDGFVDLFVGNENVPSQLFRNRRDGTFEDVAAQAGVAGTGFTKAVAAADVDNDGDTDLYVSNLGGRNAFYRNDGNWRFTERAAEAGVPGAGRGFPAWFFDYDNDGWDDLFVSSYYLSVDETARTYLGMPANADTMKLYRNQGNGQFTDVTREAGLAKVWMPMGSNFGDIDNDGFLDIYLGTGSPSYGSMVRSVLLRNRSGQSFVDVTTSSGTGELHKGHGVAFADIDGDGDQEIVFKVGGATPGDAHRFRLFNNPGHGNDWLGLRLTGVKSNRAAIGARITVTVEDAAGTRRAVHRTVNSGGSFGASPLQQHVGLGRSARRVDVEIRWPATRTRQRFDNVPKNRIIEVREMDTRFTEVARGR